MAPISRQVVNPAAMLTILCNRSGSFDAMLRSTLARKPCNLSEPWDILAYTDDAAPGNLLSIDQSRKSYLFYWVFQQVQPEILTREAAWLIGGLIRTSVVKTAIGGVSAIFKAWLKLFFRDACNLTTGITIHSPRGPFTVVAKLSSVLADDDAFSGIWSSKTSSGNKPCFKCVNVVSERSGWSGNGHVSVACDNPNSFVFQDT